MDLVTFSHWQGVDANYRDKQGLSLLHLVFLSLSSGVPLWGLRVVLFMRYFFSALIYMALMAED